MNYEGGLSTVAVVSLAWNDFEFRRLHSLHYDESVVERLAYKHNRHLVLSNMSHHFQVIMASACL